VLLRQLEYLSALARERHFARAAAACHVSQPALSAGIRRLEAELGVQVVRRGRRFDGFTPEGERVGLTGQLRVGAIPTALPVSSLLTEPFRVRHPHVRISLESLSSREIVYRLAEFELDIGMTYVDGEPLGTVRTVPLYRERYLLLSPDDGQFADRDEIDWAELAEIEMCLLAPTMQNRRILDRNLAEAGVTVQPSVEADAVSVLYAHVGTRRWSTVIAHAWLHMFGVPPGMRVIPMARPRRAHQVGLVLADRDPEPMLARALLDVVRELDVRAELNAVLRAHLGES
jgi:DNA-binding transcriptional LysR family regulator